MKLWWVKGYSLTQKESTLIPAQLIYVPYHFCKEPAIRFPITTGAATGSSLGGAILRGICEVAERDSFMIFYLNKLIPIRIDLTNSRDKTLRLISGNFKRYNLELYVFDISTDIPTVSIMAIIIDKTGIGPAVAVGLNSSLSPKDAILGAIEEAQHTRPWMRDEMFKRSKSSQSKFIVDLLERGLLWAKLDKVRHLDFFLNSKKLVGVDQFIITKSKKVAKDVKSFIEWFKNNNLEVVFADVTQPEIKKQGFFVVKVVIPKLQPLYLIEKFKYLGGERLYQIPKTLGFTKSITSEEKLNKLPHPFL